jgi:HK97 family phage portal protein
MGLLARLFGTSLTDPAHIVSAYEPDGEKAVSGSPEFVHTISGLYPSLGDYGAMYRKQPAVRAVVDWLARNIGQLNPKVYERVGNVDRIEVAEHPLARVLRAPNPDATRFRHLRDTVSDLAIYDRAVWLKMRQGRARAVVRIPPKFLTVEMIEGRSRWVDTRSGRRMDRAELVVFRGYSPDGDDAGVSPLETLRRVLAEEFASQQNRENMWRNSARQSGWIQRPDGAPQWSDDARRRFRADLESVMSGGANAGRIGILEEGMTWNASSFSPKDTEYIDGRRLTYEEVCVEYGMTPGLLGMGHDTASAADSRQRQAYQDVLGPWLRMIQDEIELQLLPDFEPLTAPGRVYVEFNLAEKLKASFEEQSKTLVSSIGVPYMTVNEGRARLNLPRIDQDWANTPVQPLNVMYGGQPAVTVPTEDPGTPGSAAAGPPQVKIVPPVDADTRDEAAKEIAAFMRGYFDRQERAVVASWGKRSAKPREKWDDELRGDLFVHADAVVRSVGFLTAGQMGGKYTHARSLGWLNDRADAAAKSVNDHTFAAVDAAEDVEQVRAVFEEAKTSRAEEIASSLASALTNFARAEAVRHSAELGDG